MATDAGGEFLAALQLGDSALPIGRYTQSLGLEALLSHDPALDAAGLEELVAGHVVCGVATLDGVAVAHAHRAHRADDLHRLLALDRAVEVRKLAPSSARASRACGRRLAVLSPELTDDTRVVEMAAAVRERVTPGHLAVVEGLVAAACGLSARQAVLLELRGAAATLLSAAVRLGRLSSSAATGTLRRLGPALACAAEDALTRNAETMTSSALEAEVHALAHARLGARLFAS